MFGVDVMTTKLRTENHHEKQVINPIGEGSPEIKITQEQLEIDQAEGRAGIGYEILNIGIIPNSNL